MFDLSGYIPLWFYLLNNMVFFGGMVVMFWVILKIRGEVEGGG